MTIEIVSFYPLKMVIFHIYQRLFCDQTCEALPKHNEQHPRKNPEMTAFMFGSLFNYRLCVKVADFAGA
jgi:hypothetical protein